MLRLAFLKPLRYDQNGMYGTPEFAFLFNALAGISGGNSEMVHHDALEFANGEDHFAHPSGGRPESHGAAAPAWRSARDSGGRAGKRRNDCRAAREGIVSGRDCLP